MAVGETELDFTSNCGCIKQVRTCQSIVQCNERNQANQEEIFLNHLQLAAIFDKPVVLHCRDHGDGTAAARVLQLIHQHNFINLKFLFGNFERIGRLYNIAQSCIWHNFWTESGLKHSRKTCTKIPDNQLVLETNTPYLPL